MSWEGFQDLEKIGIEDPPDSAEDDCVQERNWGKFQTYLDERENKLGTAERMDSEKILKGNRGPNPGSIIRKLPGRGHNGR